MGETIERPKLDQELARRYVEKAAKELSSWPSLELEDRVNLFFAFAQRALLLFSLKHMRPMGIVPEIQAYSQYYPIGEWLDLGGEVRIAGVVYNRPEIESFGGAIMLLRDLFELPVAAGAVGVFSFSCVSAIQREIDEVNKEGLRDVSNGPARELYQEVKSAECNNFHALVAMEMRFISEYAEHLPEKIEVYLETEDGENEKESGESEGGLDVQETD